MKIVRLVKKWSALPLNMAIFAAFGLSGTFAHADTDQLPNGLYRIALASNHNIVYTKRGSCDEFPADDSPVDAPLNPDLFRQKWFVTRQANGAYTIASECQPTVFLTDGGSYWAARYGTNGQVGAFGDWDPLYNYKLPHFSTQEFYIVKTASGHWTYINAATGAYYSGEVDFLPTN